MQKNGSPITQINLLENISNIFYIPVMNLREMLEVFSPNQHLYSQKKKKKGQLSVICRSFYTWSVSNQNILPSISKPFLRILFLSVVITLFILSSYFKTSIAISIPQAAISNFKQLFQFLIQTSVYFILI